MSSLLIYLIISVFVYFYADKLIFPYQQSSYTEELSGLVLIKSEDNKDIAMRFWPNGDTDQKGIVIYFHGNYLDIGHLDDVAAQFNHQGFDVLAMDYRGYGFSEGYPTEKNVYMDSIKVYEHVLKLGYKPHEISIVGRSIGTGVAVNLAKHRESRMLVLISPFITAFRVVTRVKLFPFDQFDNLSKINDIDVPVIVLHGSNDDVIADWHGIELFNEYKGRKKYVKVNGAGHNDIWQQPENRVIKSIVDFSDSLDLNNQ